MLAWIWPRLFLVRRPCQWAARTNNNQRFSRPLINRDGGILICVKFKPINLPAHTRIIHKSIWDMNNDLV